MPVEAVSVLPCWAVPLIDGDVATVGPVAVVEPDDGGPTTSVRAEYASALPALLVAVTRTLLRPPTS